MTTTLHQSAIELSQEAEAGEQEAAEYLALVPHAGEDASELLHEVAARLAYWEKKRTDITAPLMLAKRRIDQLFRPLLTSLGQAKEQLKVAVARDLVSRRAIQHQAIAQGDVAQAQAVQASAPRVHTRPVLRFRVVDMLLIPREYLAIQETAVIAALKAGTAVPGIEAYYEEVVIAR